MYINELPEKFVFKMTANEHEQSKSAMDFISQRNFGYNTASTFNVLSFPGDSLHSYPFV